MTPRFRRRATGAESGRRAPTACPRRASVVPARGASVLRDESRTARCDQRVRRSGARRRWRRSGRRPAHSRSGCGRSRNSAGRRCAIRRVRPQSCVRRRRCGRPGGIRRGSAVRTGSRTGAARRKRQTGPAPRVLPGAIRCPGRVRARQQRSSVGRERMPCANCKPLARHMLQFQLRQRQTPRIRGVFIQVEKLFATTRSSPAGRRCAPSRRQPCSRRLW